MLALVAGNLHRDVSDVRLFELGTVFSGTTEKVESGRRWRLARWGACRSRARSMRRGHRIPGCKRVVEQVLERFQMRAAYFDRFPAEAGLTPEWLHPYRAARWLPRARPWDGLANCIRARPRRAS